MALRRTYKSLFCSSSQVATKTTILTTILKNKTILTTKSICDMKTSLKTKTILTTKSSVIRRLCWQRKQSWQRSLSLIRRLPWRWRQSWQRRLHWRRRLLWWWKLSMQGCALVSLQWSNCQCNNLRTCFGIFAMDVHWLLAMILF